MFFLLWKQTNLNNLPSLTYVHVLSHLPWHMGQPLEQEPFPKQPLWTLVSVVQLSCSPPLMGKCNNAWVNSTMNSASELKPSHTPLCRLWFSSSRLFIRETNSWSPCEEDFGRMNDGYQQIGIHVDIQPHLEVENKPAKGTTCYSYCTKLIWTQLTVSTDVFAVQHAAKRPELSLPNNWFK